MLRNRLVTAVIIAVTGALVAGIIIVVGKSGQAPATVSGAGVDVHVSLGEVTSQAAQITVGGHSYQLRPGRPGTRHVAVALAAGAGGVAVVRDRTGHVLATAPVWAVPGQPSRAAEATCRSTAFDQFLLTPGVAGPDPLGVDLLWSLAGHGQAGRDVAALSRLICAGLERDPGHLSHPTPAEIRTYKKVYIDYVTELTRLAARMPPLAWSAAGIRSELPANAPSARTTASRSLTQDGDPVKPFAAVAAADHLVPGQPQSAELTSMQVPADNAADKCADKFVPVDTAVGSTSAIALCTDGHEVDAENNSAAWAFLYRVPPDRGDSGPGIPRLPSAIVPGRTSDFPSIDTIIGAIAHDYVTNVKNAGCSVLRFAHIDVCHAPKKPPESAVSALFNLVEAGTMKTRASVGYYSIAWGDDKGDQSSFPAAATAQAVQTEARYSENLTFISSVIAPTVGLILDHQLKLNLAPDQLPLLLPVFNELAGSALQFGVNGAPATASGRLRAVADTAKALFARPGLLGDIMAAFFPDVSKLGADLAKQLAEYIVGLEVPVAGWAALLVKLVADGSSAATLVLSIAGMFDALTEPSYSSWAPALPVTSCPVPQGMGAAPGFQGPTAPPVPASTAVPPSISLPPGTTVFGTGLPGSSVVAYSLAPSGFTCGAIAGADGSFVISFDAPGSRSPSLTYDYSPGGAGLALDLACPYIPAIKAADATFRGGQQDCVYPGGDVVTQVPTGARDLWAATVRIPPDVTDPNLPASGNGRDQTLAVVLASLQSHPDPTIVQAGGQAADCALPASEQAVCVAGLQYFATQSLVASGGRQSVAAVLAAVSGL